MAETGCVVKTPAIMACVPSAKANVTPEPPGGGGSGTPNAFGCYKVKCPKGTALPTIALNDQFGSRSVTPKATKIVCAPSSSAPATTTTTTTTGTTCPPATAAYCGSADCGQGGFGACDPFVSPLCPQGMTCTSSGGTCGCTGAAIPCGDSRLSGLTCNFCKWGTCPPGMTCGGVPKNGACGYDCACR